MESVARSSTPNPPSFSDLCFNSGKAKINKVNCNFFQNI